MIIPEQLLARFNLPQGDRHDPFILGDKHLQVGFVITVGVAHHIARRIAIDTGLDLRILALPRAAVFLLVHQPENIGILLQKVWLSLFVPLPHDVATGGGNQDAIGAGAHVFAHHAARGNQGVGEQPRAAPSIWLCPSSRSNS